MSAIALIIFFIVATISSLAFWRTNALENIDDDGRAGRDRRSRRLADAARTRSKRTRPAVAATGGAI